MAASRFQHAGDILGGIPPAFSKRSRTGIAEPKHARRTGPETTNRIILGRTLAARAMTRVAIVLTS